MRALFEHMSVDINQEEWVVLRNYVQRFMTVHPKCLDWVVVAADNPRILIGLLLIGGLSLFETVYEWQEYLPFKWWMLPISDWEACIRSFLEPFGDQEEMSDILRKEVYKTLNRIDQRSDSFKVLLEYLCIKVLNCSPATNVLSEVNMGGVERSWEKLEQLARNMLLREKAESRWPPGIDRGEWAAWVRAEHQPALRWFHTDQGYQRAVLDAPLIAAYFSVFGWYPKYGHRVFFSALRDFHPEWFDTAFRAVQAILLTQFGMSSNHE